MRTGPISPFDPYPLRLLSDPQGELIRAVGVGRDDQRRGFISQPVIFVVDQGGKIRWLYTGDGSANDRAGPNLSTKMAVAVARGKELPKA